LELLFTHILVCMELVSVAASAHVPPRAIEVLIVLDDSVIVAELLTHVKAIFSILAEFGVVGTNICT